MTGKESNKDNDRLAQLYREQGDIEPGPGVDQRIRARAKADTRLSGMPRPAHWLGGVAVAASLFVVVSIVTNTQPPEAELPASESDRASASEPMNETERAESLSVVARRARGSVDESEGRALNDRAAAPAAEQADQADEEIRFEISFGPDGPSASEMLERWSETGPSPDDALELEPPPSLTAEERLQAVDEKATEAGRALWLIERLISVGNSERARAEVDEFRERYPEREIPPELLAALEQLESSANPD